MARYTPFGSVNVELRSHKIGFQRIHVLNIQYVSNWDMQNVFSSITPVLLYVVQKST